MDYCFLGKSDLRISRIGFGTMSLELNNPITHTILLRALDAGINFFDTADMYQQGLNETLLGQVFRGKRDRIILATKVGNKWRADGSGWDWKPSKNYILSTVEESLRRLQTDYIDLYQLHGGTLQDPIDDIIQAFEQLKQEGKIRFYGISSIRPNVIREYVNRSSIVSVMMQYSLLDRRPEEEMLPFLAQNQVGVLTRGSIAKGLLLSKPPLSYLGYSAEQVNEAAVGIRNISGGGQTPFQMAVRFVLKEPAVCSAVIGIRTPAQLEDAIGVGDLPVLSALQLKTLGNILPANVYTEHR